MSDEISRWLHDLGMDRYIDTFVDNAVDPEILPDLTEADLRELGVSALGHRKLLLRAIRLVRSFCS